MVTMSVALICRDREGDLLAGCEDHVCQNVILNLSPGIKRNLVGLMMSLVIILSYILILAPAREHLERFFLRYSLTKSVLGCLIHW